MWYLCLLQICAEWREALRSVGVSARTREGIPAGTCAAAGGVIPEKCQSCPSILPGKGRRCVFVLRSCRKDVLGVKLHPPCFCSCSLAGEPAEPGSHSPAPDPPAHSRGAPAVLQWGLGGWGRGCRLLPPPLPLLLLCAWGRNLLANAPVLELLDQPNLAAHASIQPCGLAFLQGAANIKQMYQ